MEPLDDLPRPCAIAIEKKRQLVLTDPEEHALRVEIHLISMWKVKHFECDGVFTILP